MFCRAKVRRRIGIPYPFPYHLSSPFLDRHFPYPVGPFPEYGKARHLLPSPYNSCFVSHSLFVVSPVYKQFVFVYLSNTQAIPFLSPLSLVSL